MSTYYITIFFVCFFCAVAQTYDYSLAKTINTKNIEHTPVARNFWMLSVFILIIVAGFRYRVGTDYGNYYRNYHDYASKLFDAIREINEPGYPFISFVSEKIYDDGATAIFISSLVCIALPMWVVYRNSEDLFLSTLLFIFLGCWHGGFNGVRQYLAAAVLFCGYKYLKEQKLIKYLAIVFIAFLFHRSAIVMVTLYLIVHQKINIKNTIVIIVVTWLLLRGYNRIFALANWVMDSEYSLDNVYTARSVNILRIFVSCSPMVLFLAIYWNKYKNKEITFYLNLLIVNAVIRIITMNSALLFRIGIYTSLFQVIAIPELLKGIPEKERRFIKVIMIILYGIFWWYEIFKSSSLREFHWIWQR